MADAQREQEARQWRRLAGLDASQQVLGPFGGDLAGGHGLGRHAVALVGATLHFQESVQREPVQVGDAVHVFQLDEVVDVALAQAFDVHHAAAGEMADRLLALRRAEQAARTARHRLTLFPHHVRAADRAALGQFERRIFGLLRGVEQVAARHVFHRAALEHHGHDFGDHVTGTAHDHGVTHAHVLAADFVFVVQRGVGDRHAADKHRRQPRHRRDGAGAPDLHADRLDGGQRLLRRILVRHRPARLARAEAQLALQRQRIDLVDHAVDIERQAVALGADGGVKLHQPFAAHHRCTLLADRKAEGDQCVEHAGMRLGHPAPAGRLAQAIGEERQRALGGHLRIELAHCAGGGVARVDEGLLAAFALAGVEALEIVAPHVDLAAHFEHVGHGTVDGPQAERDLADGADILRDVFTGGTVAARGGLDQEAPFVAQVDRQAVELEFGRVFDGRIGFGQPQLAAHAGIEGERAVGGGVGLGADRQHRHHVPHRGELRQDGAAHPQRGRIRRAQFGVFGFQRFQRAIEPVVFGVRHAGLVQHVVLVGVAVQRRAQRGCPRLGCCAGRGVFGLAHR